MELAALIISAIALLLSMSAITWQLAKHFSTHAIQMVPIDPFASFGQQQEPQPKPKPLGDVYRDFDAPAPLDASEQEYFKKYNK